uniref:Uncharacterized protein n=1 Tax=Meloidogyne floridensis TaxID=298350 RepID=A0A915NM79_9BILA
MQELFVYLLMILVIRSCWSLKRAYLDETKLKPYPCPVKESCCDEYFKPYDEGADLVCRAAKRCYVHTLDKLYKHGDKIGQELDDSLGVEKSGRVPSGKYNMHIDLKECYPGAEGVLTRHYSRDADKFIFYCTSNENYGDCDRFYHACYTACSYGVLVRDYYSRPQKQNIHPCPGCQLWCAKEEFYTCDYTCKKEGIVGDEKHKYPLCDKSFRPFDKGAEKLVKNQ